MEPSHILNSFKSPRGLQEAAGVGAEELHFCAQLPYLGRLCLPGKCQVSAAEWSCLQLHSGSKGSSLPSACVLGGLVSRGRGVEARRGRLPWSALDASACPSACSWELREPGTHLPALFVLLFG